ncbi:MULTISPECIES: 5-carboxymethyl-2-hydroxymuconate Delta-isomerase [Microvirgula]|uniref:5-carboxymethyl-2-hydroxymuconate Delta-isomerase n=1 Tax=Microvirgula TaxID=57479 RepID=UPI00048DDBEB|nr:MULTISPECIES: 5-carboxymethyl-2-hydroxymuconate Delta-isomerase [Microvirgula]RAS17507.1 5-carboxymethyl-2-hydroxymuconate isomerase [Microvirgula sp. AG722]
MPHLTLEHNLDLDARSLLLELNRTLIASGHFSADDIKSRAYRADVVCIGEDADIDFVHVTLFLLSGRSADERRALTAMLLDTLTQRLANRAGRALQMTVDAREMERALYAKAVTGPLA